MFDPELGYDEYLLDTLQDLLCDTFFREAEAPLVLSMAMHQLQAEAASKPELTPADHTALALLISRWSMAFLDIDDDPQSLDQGWNINPPALARVLGVERAAFEASLQKLKSAGLILLQPGDGEATVSFAPGFAAVSLRLAPVLSRDVVERHGVFLRKLASDQVEGLREAITDYEKPTPKTQQLKTDFDLLVARMSVAELEARWADSPSAVYAWFDELAAIEERAAILGMTSGLDLRKALTAAAPMKIRILSGDLTPPQAPANAA